MLIKVTFSIFSTSKFVGGKFRVSLSNSKAETKGKNMNQKILKIMLKKKLKMFTFLRIKCFTVLCVKDLRSRVLKMREMRAGALLSLFYTDRGRRD